MADVTNSRTGIDVHGDLRTQVAVYLGMLSRFIRPNTDEERLTMKHILHDLLMALDTPADEIELTLALLQDQIEEPSDE